MVRTKKKKFAHRSLQVCILLTVAAAIVFSSSSAYAKNIFDTMAALDDYDMRKVSKVTAVEVKVEIQGKSLRYVEPWHLIIVKEAGHWRLFSVGLDASIN